MDDPMQDQPHDPAHEPRRPAARRRLTRSHDRKIAGVCGGVADYFDMDPTVARIAAIVLLFFPPVGFGIVIAYVAAWIIMPEPEGDAPARLAREDGGDEGGGIDGAVVLGVILLGAGLIFLSGAIDRAFGFPWFGFNIFRFFWPLALIALGALLLMNSRRGR